MTYYELTPAYGRDYKTKKDVVEAWTDGKDFLGDYQLGFQLVNRQTICEIGRPCQVNLRYAGNRKLAVVKER